MTLATSEGDGGALWCAHAFYAWEPDFFIFSTDPDTRHGAAMEANPHVAAAIALETRVVGRVQGLQIEGRVYKTHTEQARRAYFRRFPYAAAMPDGLTLWALEPTCMKLTDNTLGFGKKIVWQS